MTIQFNTSYVGQKKNEIQSNTDDDFGLKVHKRQLDIEGVDAQEKPDPTSVMHVNDEIFDGYSASAEDHRNIIVTDIDKKPNLKVQITDSGDVTITNKGEKGEGQLTLSQVMVRQGQIDSARKKIEQAGNAISQVKVEYGTDWQTPYARISVTADRESELARNQSYMKFKAFGAYGFAIKRDIRNFAARIGFPQSDYDLRPVSGSIIRGWEFRARNNPDKIKEFEAGVIQVLQVFCVARSIEVLKSAQNS